jgi:heat-inducible transcriptional repressor
MSRLSDEGYISRPHVSAGGIPSDQGYRYYVESLSELPGLPVSLRRQIDQRFGWVEPHVELWSQQCAAILSHLTANLAIVTMPRANSPRLRHIQLVHLQEYLVLLIIVLQEARLLRRLLPMEEGVGQESLNQVAGKLNDCLSGMTTDEIESNQLDLTALEERVKRDSVGLMREAGSGSSPEHCVDGLRRLLNQPEFSQSSRAKELVEMVEERVLLESVLSEVPAPNDIAIYIGEENQRDALRPFGVILCGYGIPGQVGGTICVIGPTRMGYPQAISGVRYLSAVMSQMVQEVHGSYPDG